MKKYTAEQIEGEVADMSAEGYPDGLRTNMLRAYAATLRQQAERGDVAVSAWREEWAGSDPGRGWYIRESTGINGRVVAYLGENIASELVREVIAAHNASLFIGKPEECADACPPQQVCDYCQAVAPLLRAPVEQGGRVECRFGEGDIGIVSGDVSGRPAVFLTEVAAHGEVGKPIPDGGCGATRVVLTFPTKEQADRVRAAIAQNTQSMDEFECLRKMLAAEVDRLIASHAERARVPDEWRDALRQAMDFANNPPKGHDEGMLLVDLNEHVEKLLAAAPSQPEESK